MSALNVAYLLTATAVATGVIIIGIVKHGVITSFFRQSHVTTSSAVEVVELLKAEIEELRTQRVEDRQSLATAQKEIERLSNEIKVLRSQITAEEPIRELTRKLDEHIGQVNHVLERLEQAS